MSWIPNKHGTDLMYLDLFVSLAWVYQQDSDRWFICGRPEGVLDGSDLCLAATDTRPGPGVNGMKGELRPAP